MSQSNDITKKAAAPKSLANLTEWLRTNKFYRSTECFGLRYSTESEYDSEAYIWHVLLVLFSVTCILHLRISLREYSEETQTQTSVALTRLSDYERLSNMTVCHSNLFGGSTANPSDVPRDLLMIGHFFDEFHETLKPWAKRNEKFVGLPMSVSQMFPLYKMQCAAQTVRDKRPDAQLKECLHASPTHWWIIQLLIRRYLQAIYYFEKPTHEMQDRTNGLTFDRWLNDPVATYAAKNEQHFMNGSVPYAQSQFWLDAWLQKRRQRVTQEDIADMSPNPLDWANDTRCNFLKRKITSKDVKTLQQTPYAAIANLSLHWGCTKYNVTTDYNVDLQIRRAFRSMIDSVLNKTEQSQWKDLKAVNGTLFIWKSPQRACIGSDELPFENVTSLDGCKTVCEREQNCRTVSYDPVKHKCWVDDLPIKKFKALGRFEKPCRSHYRASLVTEIETESNSTTEVKQTNNQEDQTNSDTEWLTPVRACAVGFLNQENEEHYSFEHCTRACMKSTGCLSVNFKFSRLPFTLNDTRGFCYYNILTASGAPEVYQKPCEVLPADYTYYSEPKISRSPQDLIKKIEFNQMDFEQECFTIHTTGLHVMKYMDFASGEVYYVDLYYKTHIEKHVTAQNLTKPEEPRWWFSFDRHNQEQKRLSIGKEAHVNFNLRTKYELLNTDRNHCESRTNSFLITGPDENGEVFEQAIHRDKRDTRINECAFKCSAPVYERMIGCQPNTIQAYDPHESRVSKNYCQLDQYVQNHTRYVIYQDPVKMKSYAIQYAPMHLQLLEVHPDKDPDFQSCYEQCYDEHLRPNSTPCDYFEYTLRVTGRDSTDGSSIAVNFHFQTGKPHVTLQQDYTFNVYRFIADVGGVLEFWIGAGLMSLIHVFTYVVKGLVKRLTRRKRQRNAIADIVGFQLQQSAKIIDGTSQPDSTNTNVTQM